MAKVVAKKKLSKKELAHTLKMREIEQTQKIRVRMELSLRISELIYNFKSKEEPTYKKPITKEDIIYILSHKIARMTE